MISARYKITDLERLDGDVLLFGGVYSNLQALLALSEVADSLAIPPGRRICTGDMAGYCADTHRVLNRMSGDSLGMRVAGNVEKQLAEGQNDCGCGFEEGSQCDLASRRWVARAQNQLALLPDGFLGELPDMVIFRHAGLRYAVIHGGLTVISRFIWPNSDEAVFAEEITAIEREVGRIDGVIAGHSGIAVERHVAGRIWINAGAIGMPSHDGRSQTRYAILGQDGVRFYALDYDHQAAVLAMRDSGLTQGYEKALGSGCWPSEDILPKEFRH